MALFLWTANPVNDETNFEIISNREGLVKNDAYSQLVGYNGEDFTNSFFYQVFRKFEKFIFNAIMFYMVDNKTMELNTETLGKFTEEVILPGVEKIVERKSQETEDKLINRMDKRIASSENKLIGEINKQIASSESKLINEMDKRIAVTEDKLIYEMEKRDNKVIEELRQIKSEILSAEDKLVGKLDRILKEQMAITYNYKILEKRITKLEAVVMVLARKLNLSAEEFGLVK